MSVSIRREPPKPAPEDWDPSEEILFCAGTFELLDRSSVEHRVEVATDFIRQGQALTRTAQLEDEVLTLSNETPTGGTARLKWRRRPR
jgi:hypothetical protein